MKRLKTLQVIDIAILIILVLGVVLHQYIVIGIVVLFLFIARMALWYPIVDHISDKERTIEILQQNVIKFEEAHDAILDELKAKEDSTKELDRNRYNLYILYHAARSLSGIMDVGELIRLTIDMVSEVMSVESGLIYLVDEEADLLRLGASKGI